MVSHDNYIVMNEYANYGHLQQDRRENCLPFFPRPP
jgi:hypothetical protein